jgi:uncharacterized protein
LFGWKAARVAKLLRMSLTLLDWRRRIAALYGQIRATHDPSVAHRQWRDARHDLLRHHPESPVPADQRADYPGAPVAPYDPRLRFELDVDEDVAPERMDVPTATDGVVPFDRVGRLHVPDIGDLDVWWLGSYGGGLFIPVRDATARSTTYGGGRYLVDTVKGADLGGHGRRLVVDFNFAYNPSCAYDPAWVCPLAPPGNVVASPIVAGELMASDQ